MTTEKSSTYSLGKNDGKSVTVAFMLGTIYIGFDFLKRSDWDNIKEGDIIEDVSFPHISGEVQVVEVNEGYGICSLQVKECV